jgi:ABC-2 type transport system permease protein
LVGWLINGFAPLVPAIAWLKYLSPFYYYTVHDPLTRGIGIGDLAVLAGLTVVLTGAAMAGIQRRDLRG